MERHDTILLACAHEENRRHLNFVLNEHFNLLEAINIQQAMLLLEQNIDCIAALVLGSSVVDEKKLLELYHGEYSGLLEQVPVIIVSAEGHKTRVSPYLHSGAADVIPHDYDAYGMVKRIRNAAQLNLSQKKLDEVVEETAAMLRRSNDTLVDALSSIIEYRSVESGHHILRIRNFTHILMNEVMKSCPEYSLDERTVAIISSAAALHDIGKIAIPDAILMKPGPLTAEERKVMETHAMTGCMILDRLGDTADQEYQRYAHNICHYHHERWDGRGYPEGLVGDAIPICAQVVGLADAYDALTSKRVYKESYSFDRAVNMILKGECGVFSPKLLECFKNVTEQYAALSLEYADGRKPEESLFDMTLPLPQSINPDSDTLDRIRGKYYAMVHYVNAFLLEVNLDKNLFHVVYNPYPELARLEEITTIHQLSQLMLNDIVVPEEREAMDRLIHETIPKFVDEDLRRASYQFHYQEKLIGEKGCFEVTLLRIGSSSQRRSLALIFRKLKEDGAAQISTAQYIEPECTYICRNDEHFTLVESAKGMEFLCGYRVEEIKALFQNHLDELLHPDDKLKVREEFTRQLRNGTEVRMEHRVMMKDGSAIWVIDRSNLVVGEDGQEYLYSFLTDITRTRTAYEDLNNKFTCYRNILTGMETVLFEWDMRDDSITFSDTWEKLFEFTPPSKHFHTWLVRGAHFHPDDVPLILDAISNMENGSDYEAVEARMSSSQGRYTWCRFRAGAERDITGRLQKVNGIISNIEAEKQAERNLKDKAERDSLTKLLNKAAGRKKIEDYLQHYPDGVDCSMLIIDLDNFKQVNDQYGHLFGDAVLTKVSKSISRQFREQDVICRIGGDEFMVLVRGLAKKEVLEYRCRQLIDSINSDLREENSKLNMSCSVGVALAPEDGKNYYELFNHADQALYQAKARGKNGFCFYEANSSFPERLIRGTAISNHIDSDEEPGLADDNIVRHAFRLLHTAKDNEAAINEVIAYLGRKTNVSRVYIFENSDDNKYCYNTFEWCNEGIEPEINELQRISYEKDIPGYQDNFNEQGVFYCPDIAVLPKEAYDIVEPQGIKSMLQCAIRQDGIFRGYIGFDECVEQRLWTKEEIEALSYFSEILSVFLMKHREQEKLNARSEEMHTLLDNQNALIYIIDPDDMTLIYRNEKTATMIPTSTLGEPCYKTLMQSDKPCPGCPAQKIREKGVDRSILIDRKYGSRIMMDATMIHWHGKKCCLMNGRKIPDEM